MIFEKNPSQHCERIIAMSGKEESSERTKTIVHEIRLELDDPTQQVRDILACVGSEEELRHYLRYVADQLEGKA